MSTFGSLEKQFTRITAKIGKAKTVATYRALNKAAARTKTRLTRTVSKASGLKSSIVSKRIMTKRASANSLRAFVSFGVKYGVPLDEMKPKEKTVKIGRGKKARSYRGVTVKLPEGRVLVPRAFLWSAPSGKSLIVQRKGSARRPLQRPTFSLRELVKSHERTMSAFMRDEFNRSFDDQFEYELQKIKG
ncbi:MAG: phage tail protein [Bdellovibrionales bacterium]|nr:phage tail protein [Bdellovibrionales bacterium]